MITSASAAVRLPTARIETRSLFLGGRPAVVVAARPEMNSLLVSNRIQVDELAAHFDIPNDDAEAIRRFLHSHLDLPSVLHALALEVNSVFGEMWIASSLSYIVASDEASEGVLVTVTTSDEVEDALLHYDAVVTSMIWDRSVRAVAHLVTFNVEVT